MSILTKAFMTAKFYFGLVKQALACPSAMGLYSSSAHKPVTPASSPLAELNETEHYIARNLTNH